MIANFGADSPKKGEVFPISRVTKDPLVRQTEILDAAQELFLASGYQQTNVEDIIKKVRVAKGTFYYYFPSKEAVLEAIVARHTKDMLAKARLLLPDTTSPLERLQLFINLFYKLSFTGELGLFSKVLYKEKQGELINKLWRKTQFIIIPILIPLIEQCNQTGLTKVAHMQETIGFFVGIMASLLESISPAEFGHETDPNIVRNKIEIAEKLLAHLFDAPPGSIRLDPPSMEAIQ
ncbi:MAG TPA: TetR/AcrR family transcriptional regulator [Selenomonadales bacterium]|nr:TetR/AcrR family transcriptional regulator [Selenomonadales bacterium]